MRTVVLVTFTLLFGSRCAVAWADGGAVRLVKRDRGYQISVFTSPHPLRAGAVDISVLLQDDASGAPVSDVTIAVSVAPRDRSTAGKVVTATSDVATNKLFRAAVVELPAPGWWDVEISCETARGPVDVQFEMEASAPMPRLPALLPWVGWPFLAVLLFAAHRALVWRTANAITTARDTRRGERDLRLWYVQGP